MYSTNNFTTEHFYGHVLITDLEGNFINAFKVEDNYFVAQYVHSNNQVSSRQNDDDDCPWEPEMCQLDPVVINPTPKVSLGNLYTSVVPEEYAFEEAYEPEFDGSGGGNSGSSGSLNSNPCPQGQIRNGEFCGCPPVSLGNDSTCEKEEQIDTFALNGKEKCAYDALVSANGNLFNETIGTFGVEGSRYNLTFTYGHCSNGEACTSASDIDNGNLTIKISDRGLDVLEYAALLLHEGIHAEIFRYVHENGGNIDPNERVNLYDWYTSYNVQNGNIENTTIAQHQHMADRFVYPIARAIRELDGFRYPVEQYLGFGWDGLRSYGFDGYYDDNLNYIQFEDIDYH